MAGLYVAKQNAALESFLCGLVPETATSFRIVTPMINPAVHVPIHQPPPLLTYDPC
jgi:hypothetical protein